MPLDDPVPPYSPEERPLPAWAEGDYDLIAGVSATTIVEEPSSPETDLGARPYSPQLPCPHCGSYAPPAEVTAEQYLEAGFILIDDLWFPADWVHDNELNDDFDDNFGDSLNKLFRQ
ncbi:hypothetical protein JCM6882_004086 [Rhodosporidiobolus microsporus]